MAEGQKSGWARYVWMLLILVGSLVSTLFFYEFPENKGKFSGDAKSVWLDDGQKMELVDDLVFTDAQGTAWLAPSGSVVDGASIPKALWSFVGSPLTGKYRKASIIHDVFCDSKERTWQDTHMVFYEGCMASGVDETKAKLMFWAVWKFGPRWDNSGKPLLRGINQEDQDFKEMFEYIQSNKTSIEELKDK